MAANEALLLLVVLCTDESSAQRTPCVDCEGVPPLLEGIMKVPVMPNRGTASMHRVVHLQVQHR